MPHTPRKPDDTDDLECVPDIAEETQTTARVSAYVDAAPTAGLHLEEGIDPSMEHILHPKDIDLAARRAAKHAAFKTTTPSKPLKIRGDTINNVALALGQTPETPPAQNHGFSFAPAGPLTLPKDVNYFDTNKTRVLTTLPEAREALEEFDARMQRAGFEHSMLSVGPAKIRDQSSSRITVSGYGIRSQKYPRKLQLFLEFNPGKTDTPWRVMGMCDVPRFPIHPASFSTEKLVRDIESYLYGINLRWSQYTSAPDAE